MYRPKEPFNTRLELLNPTSSVIKGVTVNTYEVVGEINCSFKSYGGTETTVNDLYSVEDTANVETWYRPDITSASRFKLGSDVYEVMGRPENIDLRNQFLKFKIRAVRGGV